MSKVSHNGVIREATAEEQKEIDDRQAKAVAERPAKKLSMIKYMRNKKLSETDYMANSDYTMPEYIKTWRQTLRDLPQNNTTESQYDTLLARETDDSKANYGQLTHSVWTQPTE